MVVGSSIRGGGRRLRAIAAGIGVAAILTLSACAETSGADAATVPTPAELEGRWVTGITYEAPDIPFLLIDADGTWTGSDGCNGAQGEWSIDGDGMLDVSMGPQTMIYCDGVSLPLLFADAVSATVDGGRLRFFDDEGATTVKLSRSTSTDAPTTAP